MARLRNRIRKADYFTDGELLRWHRDKRETYSGLWAMAEDSGCLEDDPFAWKLTVWPAPIDADITVELLETWRDELVAAGKLVPYEADGKRYLFIRSFHDHESPRNPQKPDLPLPPWVACESAEGTAKDGKRWARCSYSIHSELLPNRSGVCTDSVQTQNGVCTSSPALPCPALPVKNLSSSDFADDGVSDIGQGFDEFWQRYPRKIVKVAGRKAWRKLGDADRQAATVAAERIAAAVRGGSLELKFVPYPSTFIGPTRLFEDWQNGSPAGYGGNGSGKQKPPICPRCHKSEGSETPLSWRDDAWHCWRCEGAFSDDDLGRDHD